MEYWKRYSPQLFVTASHATQFNLEMPFGKGLIVSGNNRFYALDKKQFREFTTFLRGVLFNGKEDDLLSFLKRIKAPVIETRPVPAVWVAAGNCLIGDAKKTKNSMAVTALSRYGFNQLVGYTVPSWYGKGGWGTLGLLFSNHDASSLAEAWYLNNQFILDETMTRFPKLMDVHFNSPDINGIKDDPDFARGMNSAVYGMGKDQLGLSTTGIPWPFTETLPGRRVLTNPELRPRGISTGMTRQMPPKGSPSQPTKTPKVAWESGSPTESTPARPPSSLVEPPLPLKRQAC